MLPAQFIAPNCPPQGGLVGTTDYNGTCQVSSSLIGVMCLMNGGPGDGRHMAVATVCLSGILANLKYIRTEIIMPVAAKTWHLATARLLEATNM